MGEAHRRMEMELLQKGMKPQQVNVDLSNATQRACACGCKYFVPVVAVYVVSALLSPIGKELTAQQPVLICKECGELFKVG